MLFSFLRLGPRYVIVSTKANGTQIAEVAKLWAEGKVKINVEEVLPLEKAGEAHEKMETKHVRGKIVLKI